MRKYVLNITPPSLGSSISVSQGCSRPTRLAPLFWALKVTAIQVAVRVGWLLTNNLNIHTLTIRLTCVR